MYSNLFYKSKKINETITFLEKQNNFNDYSINKRITDTSLELDNKTKFSNNDSYNNDSNICLMHYTSSQR